jgi:DNA-directed RNA polymerase specialized sigma24 family protein
MAHYSYDDLMTWKRLPKEILKHVSTCDVEASVKREAVEAARQLRETLFDRFLKCFYCKLTDEEFVIYFLREFCAMKYEEIEELTGKKQATIRVCVYRARRKIKSIKKRRRG